jgi:hypothetical protein
VNCTYSVGIAGRAKLLENLPFWPPEVGKIIAEYEFPSRDDRLAMLFHGDTGIRYVGRITIFWQKSKPNGKIWYYFRYGGYQSRAITLSNVFPVKNPYDGSYKDGSTLWLWNIIYSCEIREGTYYIYTQKMRELMEYT